MSVWFSAQDQADIPWDTEHRRGSVLKGISGKVNLEHNDPVMPLRYPRGDIKQVLNIWIEPNVE